MSTPSFLSNLKKSRVLSLHKAFLNNFGPQWFLPDLNLRSQPLFWPSVILPFNLSPTSGLVFLSSLGIRTTAYAFFFFPPLGIIVSRTRAHNICLVFYYQVITFQSSFPLQLFSLSSLLKSKTPFNPTRASILPSILRYYYWPLNCETLQRVLNITRFLSLVIGFQGLFCPVTSFVIFLSLPSKSKLTFYLDNFSK